MSTNSLVTEISDALQALAGTTGYKGLLRRFAELLYARYDVSRIGFARIALQNERPKLKRRALRLANGELLGDDDVKALEESLAVTPLKLQDLREGYARFAHAGRDYHLAVLSDPTAREGCLAFWEAPQLEPLKAQLLDLVVRQLQNESRWWRKLDKTQAMLYRDDLTSLYNTRYLEIALETELRRAQRFPTQFCLLFIDLDGFKPINDQHGHLSGSSVLKQVADVLRDSVREVDVPIRYGGDEFVVLLLGATSSKGVLAAERIRKRIEQKEFQLEDGGAARVTASIGVAAYPEHGRDRDTLLRMADETMYDSKRNGKNRVTIVGELRDRQLEQSDETK